MPLNAVIGAIDRRKANLPPTPAYAPRFHQPRNTYANPAYGNKKYVNPALANKKYVAPTIPKPASAPPSTSATRELVVNGVAFESSKRKLIRKDCLSPFGFLVFS